jgi:Contractile injection system tape measure protein
MVARDNPSAAAILLRFASLGPQIEGEALAAAEAAVDGEAGPALVMALIQLFADAELIERTDAEQWRKGLVSAFAASDDVHDALAVATAGLPLVAPFLPAFFGELDLLDEEDFRSPAAKHRAAAILHHLATGATAAPEQELPLAKALAGIGFDEVYDAGEPLTEFEIGSSEALLGALLGHAPMLGRIGITGLREAFLKRPGLLATRDGHWLLRVERRSIDVLVDRLPWSFAWVRLPWMQAPLQVEW